MTTDDPAAAGAVQRIGQAMDTANDLIGELIRKLDDTGRPRLRVVTGRPGETPEEETPEEGAAEPQGERVPRLRIVHTADDAG